MKLTNEQKETIQYGMCDGWWKRFGEAFIADLEDILTQYHFGSDDFEIYDVKEKFGALRMYSNAPEEWDDHMDAWEYISAHTCINCGKFPIFTDTTGWICPVCKECADKNNMGKLRNKNIQTLVPELIHKIYSKNGDYEVRIDMKPYYKKMGYEYYER